MSKNKDKKDILDDLNDQLEKEKEKLERARAAEDIAKKVAEIRKQEEASQKKTTNILDSAKPKAGTIKRLGSALGALSPVDAIYKANEASFKEDVGIRKLDSFVTTLGKSYAKSVIDNLKTAGTGTDYTVGQKTGRDIVSKQMGAGKGAASTVAGLALDIATDPINVVGGPAFKAISKTLSFAGKQMTTLASKAPAVEKGIDTLKSQFNVFHEIEKLYKPSSVDKFKIAFSKAAETNNFDHLAKLGFDVSKYTKKSYKPELQKNIPKEFYKVLDEAFIPSTAKENILSTGLKKTSSVYKQIMAFSPRFQSRNALGGLTQGLTEMTQNSGNLWGLKNYYDAAKMLVTKGATNKPLYNNLKAHGVMSQTGMFDTLKNEGITKLPYMIANISESLNRTALVLNKTGVGKSVNEAIQISKDTFYIYSKAYKTKLEKAFMDVIDPFYSFNKGQVSYFPSALSRNAKKYNALAKVKEGTESEAERDNPLLTPEWWKDILSVDSIGNFGFQFEDFLRTATLDTKALWSKLQPILKNTGELLIDWNVYKDKKISTDTSAKGYEGLGKIGGAVVGYDPVTRTMDPYVKYAIETALGPVLKPLAAFFDKNTPLSQGLTSIKDYDQDPKKWQQQYAMDLKNKEANNFWKNLNDRFGFTFDTGTEKKGVPSIATAGSGGSDVKYYSKPSAEMMFNINTSMRASAKLAEALRMSGDLVQGSYKSMQQELGAERWYSKVTGEDPKAYKKREEAYINYQKKTLPRYINQPGYFSAWEFENIQPTMGMNKEQIAFNKLQENYVKNKSALRSLQTQGYDIDYAAAVLKRKVDREQAEKYVQGLYYGTDASGKINIEADARKRQEELDKAYAGIDREFNKTIEKIEGRSSKATASILKDMAEATSNAYQKIDLERQAALKEYTGSDDYKTAKAVKNEEMIAAAKKAINDKYDKKRQDQIAEDAKATMESVKKVTEGQAKLIIDALSATYKRGGMEVSQYYGQVLKTQMQQHVTEAKEVINIIRALIPKDVGERTVGYQENQFVKLTSEEASKYKSKEYEFDLKYDSNKVTPSKETIETWRKKLLDIKKKASDMADFMSEIDMNALASDGLEINIQPIGEKVEQAKKTMKTVNAVLDDIDTAFNNKEISPEQAVAKLTATIKSLEQIAQYVDVKAYRDALKKLNDKITEVSKDAQDAEIKTREDNIKNIKALQSINKWISQSKLALFSEMPESDFGITSTSSGIKWGKIRRPGKQYRPEGYNVEEEQKTAKQELVAESASTKMQEAISLPGSFDTSSWMKTEEETNLQYMQRIETQLANHKLNLENIDQQSANKRKAIQEVASTWSMQNIKTLQDFELAAHQKKVQSYADMASTMTVAATNFYEASGKKSKEWFYIMKAAALAEAMVKGYQAIMNAFTAGTSSGKGVTGGFAEVAVATAFVASQIALITSQMVAGPGKAKGGPITGGSGTKDDVPIMAMGGEYVIRKSSTEKYGTAFLDALNRGLIPVSDLKFSVPHIPEPMHYQTHFAEGGKVPVSTSKTPITVELKNESGTPLQQKKSDVSFDGQQYVVSVWLDALNRNAYGLRDSLGR